MDFGKLTFKAGQRLRAHHIIDIHDALKYLAAGRNIKVGPGLLIGNSEQECSIRTKRARDIFADSFDLGFTLRVGRDAETEQYYLEVKRGVVSGLGYAGAPFSDDWKRFDLPGTPDPDRWVHLKVEFKGNTATNADDLEVLYNGGTDTKVSLEYGELGTNARPSGVSTGTFHIPIGYVSQNRIPVNDIYSPISMYFCAPDLLNYEAANKAPVTVNILQDKDGNQVEISDDQMQTILDAIDNS